MSASASSGHFPPLDGLRGTAIILVLLVHGFDYRGSLGFGRALHAVAASGWVGVTLFFVLSGFLISGILIDTKGQRFALRDFFARRSLRIFPLYFAFLAVYFFVIPHIPYLNQHLEQPEGRIRSYYWLYLTNMIEQLAGPTKGAESLSPLWSLAVEEQVYLVWPILIMMVPNRRLPWVLAVCWVASVGFRAFSLATHLSVGVTYGWAPSNVEAFAAGGLVAWASRRDWGGRILSVWGPRAAIGGICFLLGMVSVLRSFSFWMNPVPILTTGISAATILFAGLIATCVTQSDDSPLNRFLSVGILRKLGRYSYAIYLFHEPINDALRPLIYSNATGWSEGQSLPGSFLQLGLLVVIAYALAWTSWRVWEQPILSLKRYFPRQGKVVRLAPQAPDL